MLVGAAIVPAAPLLVPGMSAILPDGVREVRAAVESALAALAAKDADAAILVAAGTPPGTYSVAEASMRGFGRPDVAASISAPPEGHGSPLPPGLAVLALLHGSDRPVKPIAVDAGSAAPRLAELGTDLAAGRGRTVLVAAGDCSAGLGDRSPRWRIDGAAAWDDALVAAVAGDDTDALAALGPGEARRVAALGWAPIVVARAAAGRPFTVRSYRAPRGVGYLVADV